MTDVSDRNFATAVIERSKSVPVVVDLWAPWCGPCKVLGPIIERLISETDGQVELAKINVDENPQASQTFQVKGIPAVYALKKGAIVDGFVGAQGEAEVRLFIDRLLPTSKESEIDELISAGDEKSLMKALTLEPDNQSAVLALATLLVDRNDRDDALDLLQRIPESPATRHIAARARSGSLELTEITQKLDDLLLEVKGKENLREEYLDLLELLGPDHELTSYYRRRLTSALF